jgi:hypothetical protein
MQKVNLEINKRLMDIAFEKVNQPLELKKSASGVNQMIRNEDKFLDWLKNKVQNVHYASYEKFLSYNEENQRQNWINIPIQNERFLETKKLYKNKNK